MNAPDPESDARSGAGRASPTDLQGAMKRGVSGTGVSLVLTTALQIGQLVILSRLLDPAEFGVAGMLSVITGFALLTLDLGLGNAVISRREMNVRHISSLFWLVQIVGVLLALGIASSAEALVAWYREPRVATICVIAALTFLFSPLASIHLALLEKRLAFRSLAIMETSASAVGVAASVVIAAMDGGAAALTGGTLAGTVARAALFSVANRRCWTPSAHFAPGDLKPYLGFGLRQSIQRSINYITGNSDFLIIGTKFGAHDLGIYTLAYNLITLPFSRLNGVLSRVFFPVFSRAAHDREALRAGFFDLQKASGMLTLPALGAVVVLCRPGIAAFLGGDWSETVVIVQLLCIVGATRAVGMTSGPLVLATGRVDLGLTWSLVVVSIQIPTLMIGAHLGGVRGVAIAFCVSMSVCAVLNYTLLIRRMLGPCLWPWMKSLRIPLISAGLANLAAWIGRESVAADLHRVMVGGAAWLVAMAIIFSVLLAAHRRAPRSARVAQHQDP